MNSVVEKERAKAWSAGCDICGGDPFVHVTFSLIGRPGVYCLEHANEYSGMTFAPVRWYERLWRQIRASL